MAANKFAAKLHKSIHKIVVVLVYALLEWVLIMLLLFNSSFYYFIKKYATFFGLKPTCLWCSSVDSLFEPGKKDNSYEGLFCEDHTSQISNLGYCSNHKKLAKIPNRCQECYHGVDNASENGLEKEVSCSCCEKSFRSDPPPLPSPLIVNGLLDVVPKQSLRIEEIEEEDSIDGEGCNISNEEPQILSDVGSFYLQEAAEEDSSRSTSNSLCNENEENTCDDEVDIKAESTETISLSVAELEEKEIKYVELEKEVVGVTETTDSCNSDPKNQDLPIGFEEGILNGNETSVNEAFDDHPDEKYNEEARSILDNGDNGQQSHFNIEEVKIDNNIDPALVIEQLRTELESERSAAAIAANQTMAMITRLQAEKAAIKMEAVQYQRMMEEQAEYDQEALQLLNELVIKREKEKEELENELEVYKEKLDYEVIKEKSVSLRKSRCSSSSCSLTDDSEKLSIDLNKEMPSTGAVLDSVDMVLDHVKNWNMLDGSLEEFEQERISILDQLKELEEKLFSICDDDQEEQILFEDVKPIEHFLEHHQELENEVTDENANLCSAEVNVNLAMEKDHPTTMASAAKKLLPFLENEDGDDVEKVGFEAKKIELCQKAMEVETSDKVLAVMKEMDHVHGRLQALEADREFLRHCIGSLTKGEKGIGLLEEILQHLRELRSADTSELMICHE